jgi:hypothetical protein
VRSLAYAVSLVGVLIAPRALAVRPFITDDARVVGKHQAQVESWVRYDRTALQQWAVPAIGPIAPLEVTLGAVHGIAIHPNPHYSLAAPLLQAKLLLHAAVTDGLPGVAIIAGTFFPFGYGDFRSPVSGFTYLAATEVIGNDDVLLHANLGFAAAQLERTTGNAQLDKHARYRFTWGIATQVHLYGAANLAAEIFSGDPYAEVSGGAGQLGLRFAVNKRVQLDVATGAGLYGDPRMPPWASVGFRFVSEPLF